MPGIDDTMAFTEEDSGIIGVVIPFEQKDTGEPAEIVWVYDPETGTVVVLLANDWLCDIACAIFCPIILTAGAIGCTAACAIWAAFCPVCFYVWYTWYYGLDWGCDVFCTFACG